MLNMSQYSSRIPKRKSMDSPLNIRSQQAEECLHSKCLTFCVQYGWTTHMRREKECYWSVGLSPSIFVSVCWQKRTFKTHGPSVCHLERERDRHEEEDKLP